jgi:hypothetical protein
MTLTIRGRTIIPHYARNPFQDQRPRGSATRAGVLRVAPVGEPDQLGTRHCVRQTHAKWSDKNSDVLWEGEEVDYFWILDEAKERYAERRLALVEKGFIYSDMDM